MYVRDVERSTNFWMNIAISFIESDKAFPQGREYSYTTVNNLVIIVCKQSSAYLNACKPPPEASEVDAISYYARTIWLDLIIIQRTSGSLQGSEKNHTL